MNVNDLLITHKEQIALSDIFLDTANRKQFVQLIKEHTYIGELHKYGLPVNNKVLLQGSSGCGKTMTAKAIANALGKNILILDLSSIVSSRIGETAQHVKMIFDKAGREKAVLFLDEFDQLGKARDDHHKDVGEMRRLVNTLIQLIDYFPEDALLIAATNHSEMIDTALLRRFQLKINYQMPANDVLDNYYDHLLSRFPKHLQSIERKYGLSFAEARDNTFTRIKAALIEELEMQNLTA